MVVSVRPHLDVIGHRPSGVFGFNASAVEKGDACLTTYLSFSCPPQVPVVLQRRALSFRVWRLPAQQKHRPGKTSKQQVHPKEAATALLL